MKSKYDQAELQPSSLKPKPSKQMSNVTTSKPPRYTDAKAPIRKPVKSNRGR